ncbi:MAG: formate dehydrogenase accessory sulfurtransferase FdhD, partial [Verrucomicrobiota bacterium]
QLTRHVFSASSCGICGKATVESVLQNFPPIAASEDDEELGWITPETLFGLPEQLRKQQMTFDATGGLHASALFDEHGVLLLLREDVGRHNALDKVLGNLILRGELGEMESKRRVLLVSGRISFELIQKALAARISLIAGISAPSSLAVSFAQSSGQTLVGFLRPEGMNVYAGAERITK